MTQEEFDKAPLLDQILYDMTGMLVENHPSIAEAMDKYHQAKLKLLGIDDVSHRFSKEDLWDAWWASAIKTISFSGVDKDYERRCFEKFYENKLASLNGG